MNKTIYNADTEKNAEYAKMISDIEGCEINIISSDAISDDANLVIFNFGVFEETTTAIIYNDGTIFTPRDWQSKSCPQKLEEVADYDWMELTTKSDAIILNGLPRLL